MDLPAAPLLLPRFPPSARVRDSPLLRLPLSATLILSLLSATSSSPLRLAASLFPTLSPGEDSSVRAQPLAYNETENLRGTRRMRHMITYIETKNRPARRSAALSLFLSRSSSSLLRVSRKHRETISRSEQSQSESGFTTKHCFKKKLLSKIIMRILYKFVFIITIFL